MVILKNRGSVLYLIDTQPILAVAKSHGKNGQANGYVLGGENSYDYFVALRLWLECGEFIESGTTMQKKNNKVSAFALSAKGKIELSHCYDARFSFDMSVRANERKP